VSTKTWWKGIDRVSIIVYIISYISDDINEAKMNLGES
jgi:hypothetical protein